jgi:hypothetical protein
MELRVAHHNDNSITLISATSQPLPHKLRANALVLEIGMNGQGCKGECSLRSLNQKQEC